MMYWIYVDGYYFLVEGEDAACRLAERYPRNIVFMADEKEMR